MRTGLAAIRPIRLGLYADDSLQPCLAPDAEPPTLAPPQGQPARRGSRSPTPLAISLPRLTNPSRAGTGGSRLRSRARPPPGEARRGGGLPDGQPAAGPPGPTGACFTTEASPPCPRAGESLRRDQPRRRPRGSPPAPRRAAARPGRRRAVPCRADSCGTVTSARNRARNWRSAWRRWRPPRR